MTDAPDIHDPFRLRGKNLRRVVPQVRRGITLQRQRIRVHLVGIIVCLGLGGLGWQSEGIWRIVASVLFCMVPFLLIGFLADWHLKRQHEARLKECEHLLMDSPHREA